LGCSTGLTECRQNQRQTEGCKGISEAEAVPMTIQWVVRLPPPLAVAKMLRMAEATVPTLPLVGGHNHTCNYNHTHAHNSQHKQAHKHLSHHRKHYYTQPAQHIRQPQNKYATVNAAIIPANTHHKRTRSHIRLSHNRVRNRTYDWDHKHDRKSAAIKPYRPLAPAVSPGLYTRRVLYSHRHHPWLLRASILVQ